MLELKNINLIGTINKGYLSLRDQPTQLDNDCMQNSNIQRITNKCNGKSKWLMISTFFSEKEQSYQYMQQDCE